MKKMDYVVSIFFVLLATAILFFNFSQIKNSNNLKLIVLKNGIEIEKISLNKDILKEIDTTNKIEIKAGMVKMISANCRDQICVNTKEISKNGEMIVCLPNRIVLKIEGEETIFKEVDTIAN